MSDRTPKAAYAWIMKWNNQEVRKHSVKEYMMFDKDNGQVCRQVQNDLFAMQDKEYQAFHSKLIPNVAPERVIGVRTPQLRAYAKVFSGTPEAAAFLKALPHTYYEENNLHAFLIEAIRDYDECVGALDAFLPYVDNWATCDMMIPKVLRRHPGELLEKVREWLASGQTYTVRYAIKVLMDCYLEENFLPEYPELVASVRSEEYYVNMMVAWYFATALAKQYEEAVPYIEQRLLPEWIHRKSIQKAVESRRISEERKEYLKGFRGRLKDEGSVK